jgi:predicted DNA-binding transcriptional regulator AlpA
VDDQPGDLVGVTEIGDLLGVSRQRADQLTRTDGFPEPVAVISAGRIWRRTDVDAWARAVGRLP